MTEPPSRAQQPPQEPQKQPAASAPPQPEQPVKPLTPEQEVAATSEPRGAAGGVPAGAEPQTGRDSQGAEPEIQVEIAETSAPSAPLLETTEAVQTAAIPVAPVAPAPSATVSEPAPVPIYQTAPAYSVAVAPVAESSTTTIGAEDIVYTPYALSIGDGFKFGCGIMLASVVGVLFLVLAIAISVLIASLAGVTLPFGMSGI